MGQPHLRLSLGRMGLADNPLLPRSIPGEQPQDTGGGSEDFRFEHRFNGQRHEGGHSENTRTS
jgi:hypothetical protein